MTQIGYIQFGRDIGKKDKRRRFIWAACPQCGTERWVVYRPSSDKHIHQRCAKCSGLEIALKFLHHLKHGEGETNTNWRKGRILRTDGYVMVYVAPNDFFSNMTDKRKYVMEHRLVMAKHLNRCLLSWEVVHHKNGIRDDNRLENLELFPSSYKHDALSRMAAHIKKLEREIEKLKQVIEAEENSPNGRHKYFDEK